MGSSLIGAIASLFVGSVVAGATVVGVISSQTSAPETSPASVDNAVVADYGSTN